MNPLRCAARLPRRSSSMPEADARAGRFACSTRRQTCHIKFYGTDADHASMESQELRALRRHAGRVAAVAQFLQVFEPARAHLSPRMGAQRGVRRSLGGPGKRIFHPGEGGTEGMARRSECAPAGDRSRRAPGAYRRSGMAAPARCLPPRQRLRDHCFHLSCASRRVDVSAAAARPPA